MRYPLPFFKLFKKKDHHPHSATAFLPQPAYSPQAQFLEKH
jgi:hypothetical protein